MTGRPGETVCPPCLLDVALESASDQPGDEASWLDSVENAGAPKGRYEILEEIARGGMGVVYRARHIGLNRTVALKMILPEQLQSAAALDRFRGEAEAIAALDHSGILPIYEVGELDGIPFFSMKLAERGSLAQRSMEWRNRPREAVRLIAHIARAVHHAHERGILHRDLKPGNILLGEGDAAFVTDFGIAKWLNRDNRLTIATSALGTPHYISPEQAAGASSKLTPAADVYSLGAILYELLAGRPPFAADTALETLRLARETEAHSPRNFNSIIPRDLEVICLKCLAKEPSARYASAAALAEDLERWLEGRPILARPTTSIERGWRWTRRNRAVAALSGALILTVSALLFFQRPASPPLNVPVPPEKSVAVLPFLDLSPAKDQEYFCDGISEEILDSLAKIEGLHVVARTSSFSFKGSNLGVKEIAQKLGVQNLVEGSLRRDGNRVRVTVQLINARDGFHLWSETYERELQGIFGVQDEITQSISHALQLKLIGVDPEPKQNAEAYDLYLQGMFFSNKSTEEGLRKSLELFQRSLEKDPNSARTWAGIAKVWLWLADAYVRPLEAYASVKAAALKAVALNEKDPEGHVYLGEAKRVLEWDVAGDDAEQIRALQLDPNSATAHLRLAIGRSHQGRIEEAEMHRRAAVKADPLSPLIGNGSAIVLLCTGRIDDAIAEARRTLQLDPNYAYQNSILAEAYREKGMFSEAIEAFRKAEEMSGLPQSGLAVTYAQMGREPEARQILDQLKKFAETKYLPAEEVAVIHAALGENDEAFRWLERAYQEHSGTLYSIAVRPTFRKLQSDPRFANLLRRLGLDPAKVFPAVQAH